MKVLFWVPYPHEGASNRYRVDQYLPALRAKNISYSVRSFWSVPAFRILYTRGNNMKKTLYFIAGTLRRIIDLATIFRYDAVFVHREAYPVGPAIFETLAHLMDKPIVFDFDDAVFLPSSSRQNIFIEKFKFTHKIKDIIAISDRVIAGNNYLASFARAYNANVSIIPTLIDTDKFVRAAAKERDTVVIGWIGSETTTEFLKPLEQVFRILVARFPGLSIRIIGGDPHFDALEKVEIIGWDLSTEVGELSKFDIGIMPMPDDPWTKGKCAFKAIVYMGMGIPCVCSAVGTNNEVIVDGVNGYLARTDDEWIDKLTALIRDRSLRERIGAAGRRTIEERYSLKAYSDRFVGILVDAGNRGGVSAKNRV